jgi:hypothetical protein
MSPNFFISSPCQRQCELLPSLGVCRLSSVSTVRVYHSWNSWYSWIPIRNKNRLWWPFLLTDRDEMSNLYRGPSIGQSETRIACGGHVCKWIGTKWAIYIEELLISSRSVNKHGRHRRFLFLIGIQEYQEFQEWYTRTVEFLLWMISGISGICLPS